MRSKVYIGFLIMALGCAKPKADLPSNRTGTQLINSPASSIRLFNFTGLTLDVKVNDVPLTAFSGDPNAQGNQIGLSLFPTNAWTSGNDGSPVTLPTSLETKQSTMPIIIEPRGGGASLTGGVNIPAFFIDTTLVDDPTNPKDYYVTLSGKLTVIPRNSVSPTNPQNIKIRVYNLGQLKDTMGLAGSVTLTYADGTPVNQALSSVPPGTASSYVEMPYGAYQFKLYINGPGGVPDYTRQLTEIPSMYTVVNGVPSAQADLTTLVRGYQPGGTYSLVVLPGVFGYDITGFGAATYYMINAYRVITEQAAPTNVDWARIQGVNALSTQGITFQVDGAPMGNVSYGQASDYTIVSKGTHVITALDADGNKLAEQSFPLYAFDDITAWAYMRNDTPQLTFSNTDWTSTLYETVNSGYVDDGTSGSVNTSAWPYCIQVRFMNLSDVPYATFTTDGNLLNSYINGNNQAQNDTFAYPEAYINLRSGVPDTYNPFVLYPSLLGNGTVTINNVEFPYLEGLNGNLGAAYYNPCPLRAYASEPADGNQGAQIPGEVLAEVPTLPVSAFASGTLIYPNGPPKAENGLYTVALIGSTQASGPQAAHMIIIKHNK